MTVGNSVGFCDASMGYSLRDCPRTVLGLVYAYAGAYHRLFSEDVSNLCRTGSE